MLDGEVAVSDTKLGSRFHLLGDRDIGIVCTPPVYIAFDILQRGNRAYADVHSQSAATSWKSSGW